MSPQLDFDLPTARERERAMPIAIGRMARGELRVPDVDRETDLRQLAYLAALSQNRVRRGGDALAAFSREALARLGGASTAPARSPDPLWEMLRASLSLDIGKVCSDSDSREVDHPKTGDQENSGVWSGKSGNGPPPSLTGRIS